MGKHDNRTSMKMRRRKAQKKLKARMAEVLDTCGQQAGEVHSVQAAK